MKAVMKTGATPFYLDRYGIYEGARRMKEHGYSCIDYQRFINTETDFFRLPEEEFEKAIRDECKLIEAGGITVGQTHGPWRFPPRDFTPADREERFEAMCKGIRGTAYAGAPYYVIHPLMPYGVTTSENSEQVWDINLEFMSRLCEKGREYGVTVCLENMPFPEFPITTSEHVTKLVKLLNSDYARVCLDTGHSLVCGEQPAESVRVIGKLLAATHVHDNDGTADRHLLPGKGIADWRAFSDALADTGFSGTVSYETSVKVSNTEEQTRLELEYADLALRMARLR